MSVAGAVMGCYSDVTNLDLYGLEAVRGGGGGVTAQTVHDNRGEGAGDVH